MSVAPLSRWAPAIRRRVLPGPENPPSAADAPDWAAVRRRFGRVKKAFEAGLDRAGSDAQDSTRRAFELLGAKLDPVPAVTAQVWGAALAVLDHAIGVRYLLAARGPRVAVLALAASQLWGRWRRADPFADPASRLVPSTTGDRALQLGKDCPWTALRAELLLASADRYEQARDAALAVRRSAPPGVRFALSFAFVRELDWARDDARAYLASDATMVSAAMLLGALSDRELLLGIARRIPKRAGGAFDDPKADHGAWATAARLAPTMVLSARDDAAPALDALMPDGEAKWTAPITRRAKDVAQTLIMIDSPEVMAALLSRVGQKPILKLARSYLDAHPEAARQALREAVARGAGEPATAWLRDLELGAVAPSAALPQVLTSAPRRKLPAFWDIAALPPVSLRSGEALAATALTQLGWRLVDADPEALAEVAAACRPDELAALAVALFERWRAAGTDRAHGWALGALAALASGDVRARAPTLDTWSEDDTAVWALDGLEVWRSAPGTPATNVLAQAVTEPSAGALVGRYHGLPGAAIAFLKSGRGFDYDPGGVECGRVTLRSLDALTRVEARVSTAFNAEAAKRKDPNHGEGTWVVDAVDLVATTEGYDPEGVLCWFPAFASFGWYDPDHAHAYRFRSDWHAIASDPGSYIAAPWDPFTKLATFLPAWEHGRYEP